MIDARQSALDRRRVAAWLATLLAAVVAFAVLTSSAAAGTYSVYSCVGPSGESLPNNAWNPRRSVTTPSSAFTFGTTCPDLSVVVAPGTTLAAGEEAGFAFAAPPGTKISGYLIRRSVNVTYAGSARPTLSAGLQRTTSGTDTYWGECEAVTANCSIAASGTQSVGIAASGLQLGIECAQSTTSCAGAGIGTLRASLLESRVDITDNSAPAITFTGGTLPGANGVSGERTLAAQIVDVGGGVSSYSLQIDGVRKALSISGGSCSTVFRNPVPCPQDRDPSYTIDLADYAAGTHTAVISATDAAGNVGTSAPVSFTVPGVAGVDANGSPILTGAILSVRKGLIDGKAGRTVLVRGALKSSSGAAIAGETLTVTASSLGVSGAATKPLGSAKTAKDGSFSFKVRPNGARRVTFSFRGTAFASTIVRQRLTLSARRSRGTLSRGKVFAISGRLSGTAGAAAGAPVEIQVLNGKKWAKVAEVRAGKSGSYKWKYRFKRVTRPTLFTFRAIVRSKPDWPWPSKSSSSVRVLVLG
ncbi:MAG: hypothetical protein HYX29_03285 [Solirubrobacterales bacterium]|nr:hypothetical protein [Solirubrobacterales bacterium]